MAQRAARSKHSRMDSSARETLAQNLTKPSIGLSVSPRHPTARCTSPTMPVDASTESPTVNTDHATRSSNMADSQGAKRCSVNVLVFGASLRHDSLNCRLASAASEVIRGMGGTADFATMKDFDCPSYDQDVEADGQMPEGAQKL